MKIEIKHWYNGSILETQDIPDDSPQPMRTALEALAFRGAAPDDLTDLRQATVDAIEDIDVGATEQQSLRYRLEMLDRELAAPSVGARLDGASLVGASLVGARLDGARLDGASLVRARLDGARLDGASLDGASLDGARLDGASLDGASLVGARLVGARLDGASLDGARWAVLPAVGILAVARDDMRRKLAVVPDEVAGLLAAVREGRIDGSCYAGSCSCFVGTIAKLRGDDPYRVPGLQADACSPVERLFTAIRPGHTPERNPIAAEVERWLVEWQAEQIAAVQP